MNGESAGSMPRTEWERIRSGIPSRIGPSLTITCATKCPTPMSPDDWRRRYPRWPNTGPRKYCVGVLNLTLFERLFALRGMEYVFEDFYTHEKEIGRLCEALTEYAIGLISEWGKTDISAIFLTDDWGSQNALMISPAMWRRHFKEYYRQYFRGGSSLGKRCSVSQLRQHRLHHPRPD